MILFHIYRSVTTCISLSLHTTNYDYNPIRGPLLKPWSTVLNRSPRKSCSKSFSLFRSAQRVTHHKLVSQCLSCLAAYADGGGKSQFVLRGYGPQSASTLISPLIWPVHSSYFTFSQHAQVYTHLILLSGFPAG